MTNNATLLSNERSKKIKYAGPCVKANKSFTPKKLADILEQQ